MTSNRFPMSVLTVVPLLLWLQWSVQDVHSFVIPGHFHKPTTTIASNHLQHEYTLSQGSSTCCFAKKRGKLGNILSETGDIDVVVPKPARRPKKSPKKAKTTKAATSISPDLAKFMESKSDDTTTTTTEEDSPPENDDDESMGSSSSTTFTSFTDDSSKKTSSRRIKQAERQQKEQERSDQLKKLIESLTEIVETTNDPDMVSNALSKVREIMALNDSTASKALWKSRQEQNYKLLWAGSDDAICAVGTQLHKVPLARLQEVFWTFGNKRVVWQEVIRVLGPFPNVLNTLSGTVQQKQSNGWKLNWDSMVDGTGKEYLATEDKIQSVDLHVPMADEAILIVTTEDVDDIAKDNGKHVMVFVRDEEMQETMEKLRVA